MPAPTDSMDNKKPAALNIIWLALVLVAVVVAAYTGTMAAVTKASFESAEAAVMLAVKLIGAMALWLGIMKVAEEAGLMQAIARWIRPVMVRLFPDVPSTHPAMSAMIMNIAANMLGLGNAATPMGIKAMQELDKLNPEKETATHAMCLFLAINTSSVTLFPLGVIAVRAAAGAREPAAIFLPTLFATTCSTVVAIVAAKLMAARRRGTLGADGGQAAAMEVAAAQEIESEARESRPQVSRWGQAFVWLLVGALLGAVVYKFIDGQVPPIFSIKFLTVATGWLIPLLMSAFLITGYLRGVHVYEALTEGAKEGFNTAVRILPFMVAIFVAIGMFRASGAMQFLAAALSPVLEPLGFPAEALPVALLRPLSGSGSFGVMSELIKSDPNGFAAFLASTIQGSTETTFYVLAVYFGAVGIRRTRYALPVGLLADAAGVAGALIICRMMFNG